MKRVVLSVLILMALASASAAQSPQDTVRWIYSSLLGPGPAFQKGLDYLSSPEQRSTYFTRRMVAFFEANESYADDHARACVDFKFSIPGQDYDAPEIMRTLQLSTTTLGQTMRVVATFMTLGRPAQVTYDFIPEDGYWKIDDIAGEGFRVSQINCTSKPAQSAPQSAAANSYCFRHGEDSLRLDLHPDGRAQLEFWSWQTNGHSCSGDLPGQQVADGWSFPAEQGCRIELRLAADGGVRLSDRDHVCKFMMCGQRAMIEGLQFPHSSRIDCASYEALQY